MKSKVLTVACCFLLMLVAGTSVYAKSTVTEFTDPFAEEFADTNPCTGEPVMINITGEARTLIVEDGSGNVHGTFKLRADLTETNSNTGEVAHGSVNWNESFGSGRDTFIITGKVVHPGPGNNVIMHFLFHVSPNGMFFDSGEIDECH